MAVLVISIRLLFARRLHAFNLVEQRQRLVEIVRVHARALARGARGLKVGVGESPRQPLHARPRFTHFAPQPATVTRPRHSWPWSKKQSVPLRLHCPHMVPVRSNLFEPYSARCSTSMKSMVSIGQQRTV